MRRRLRVTCTLCASITLLCCGCIAVPEREGPVFHVDPSGVHERFEVGLLFEHLDAMLGALASEDFTATQDGLRNVNIDRAHLPASVFDVCNRYVELCNLLTDTIGSLRLAVEDCESSLENNDLTGAGLSLGISRSLLTRAREQLIALEKATAEAFVLLRRSGQGGSSSQLEQSRLMISRTMERVTLLASEYESRLDAAFLEATVKNDLLQPDLTLHVRDDAVWVGDITAVSGVLSVDGKPITNKEITLLIDGVGVGVAQTDGDGAFARSVTLPFEYVPRHIVRASYQPEGDDLGRYRAVTSDDYVMTVRFHTSTVALAVPSQMHPGLGATVVGTIDSSGPTEGREVMILVGDDAVGTRQVGPEGDFSIDFRVAENAVEGEVQVKAFVPADDSARCAPCDFTVDTEVTTVEPTVELSMSRFAFVPSLSSSLLRQAVTGTFVGLETVSVDVYSSLPLSVMHMSAAAGERQALWTQDEIHAEVQVPVECRVWDMGMRQLIVRASADEPWHRPTEATAQLMLVNLLIPNVLLVSLGVVLGLGVLNRRRLRHAVLEPEPLPLPVLQSIPYDVAVAAVDGISFDDVGGSRQLLARLYYQAVVVLQKTLGVMLRREMTLREYLVSVQQRLGFEPRIFGKLTMLAEEAMYGPREPDRQSARLGRRLLAMLRSAQSNSDGERDGSEDAQ
ncbi:MAG: DUF4129 domain-containing protein [Dehalococcoidia bacterium]|nr:DUF4129 domain-containing protein [Dehalococcoidia bacterium]